LTQGNISFTTFEICSDGAPDGTLKQSRGEAVNDFPAISPGKFRLNLDNTASPVDGVYWIVEVGDVGDNGKYEWAIVSVPYDTVLFILARDVDKFRANLEATALQKAAAYGFTQFYNKPVPIYQSASNCAYPPLP
jgi:lipocalin